MSDAQPITGLRSGQLPDRIFLCGDPARVPRIAAGWSDVEELVGVREYRVWKGTRDGVPLAVASTGIGAPSTAILVEELVKVGVRKLLRIGNSGGLAPSVAIGDLVVTTGCVRDDGTSQSYVEANYPAVADYELVTALMEEARATAVPCHAGITWSLDAFYIRNAIQGPEDSLVSMSVDGYWTSAHREKLLAMRAARVTNCEMEAGTLLTLASLFGVRAGCICVVSDLTPWPGPSAIDLDRNMDTCIEVAHRALVKIASGP
ncbi:MAG: nucleoside phosphorylase [Myxococcales bacterium]|nr:nucleoside phosphorylase [Myxococcales bacterium]